MNRKPSMRFVLVFALLLATLCFPLSAMAQSPNTVTVFAAASLTNALTDIGKIYSEKEKCTVSTSFLSSSTLAKQIENGAPANVFISADEKWMDYLDGKKLIDSSSRFNLLGNRLVLIAPADSKIGTVTIAKNFDLAKLLEGGKLAMGDPDHVPAGIYGKAALEKLGEWDSVQKNIAREDDVRAALALVGRGEAPLGIVYATDAAITKQVKVVGVFPDDSYPPVIYPAALVAGKESAAAKSFLEFLKTPESKDIFKKYGFSVK